jgi:putative Holliday junction resolvase
MRIMAIDYGKKRVGLAITDPLGVISQPFLTLETKSRKELLKRLKFIIEQNSIGLVLVGNPLSHNGQATKMSREIAVFVNELKKTVSIDVYLWDERFTSKYATNVLKDMGLKKKGSKIDQIAASLMLDEYIKSQSSNCV